MVTKKKILFEGDKIPVGDLEGDPSFSSMTVDQISEKTSDAGVTIEGVSLKDGVVTPMGGAPCARVYHSADQSIPDQTWTALQFNSERFDTDNIHSTSSNTSRLTCKTAGKYLIVGNACLERVGAIQFNLAIFVNGNTRIGHQHVWGGAGEGWFVANVTTIWDFAKDEWAELKVHHQGSGGAIEIHSFDNWSPEFMMVRVA